MFIFLTKPAKYVQLATKLHDEDNADVQIIASSNLTSSDKDFDYVINYSSVIDDKALVQDHSLCMLLRVLEKCNPESVALAGLDGYTAKEIIIYDEDKDEEYRAGKAILLNDYAIKFLSQTSLNIRFVTPSKYDK